MPREVWQPFEERFGVAIRECYGMMECSSFTTANLDGPVGSVGKPLPWFDVALVDNAGKPVASGGRGEIVVRERMPGALTRGYFNDPEATAKALRNGAFLTGDLASADSAGNLCFHGRMTDSVRVGGENVAAAEVEDVARKHPAVEECALIGVAADVGEAAIKLFVKPKAGMNLLPRELSAAMFLDKLVSDMPFKVDAIQVDGGSEFMAEFEDACKKRSIKLFLLPPRSPEINGAVERCNSSWRYEFYAVYDLPTQLDRLNPLIEAFQHRYNTYRPHGALGGKTPAQSLAARQASETPVSHIS